MVRMAIGSKIIFLYGQEPSPVIDNPALTGYLISGG
jgi:hypothetical protein